MKNPKIDLNELNKYKTQGWLKSQTHPSLPLIIWNYTKQTQYEGKWDEVTTLCRGLVTDTQGNIVAHPFRKFFNYGELKGWNKVPTGPYRAFEKLDGSIIQVFNFEGEWVISSKGSFTSEQVDLAKASFINIGIDPEGDFDNYMDPNYNNIFELIHPSNRIVLQYDDCNMVLLGIIGKDGSERHITGNPYFKTSQILFHGETTPDWEKIRKEIPDNKEGYVVVFDSGERMKLKGDEYLRLHKIVTQTTYRDVWTALRDGHDLRDFIERMPDEWIDWFHQKVGELYVKFNLIKSQLSRDLDFGQDEGLYGLSYNQQIVYPYADRKQIAKYVNTCMYPKLMYSRIDGRYEDKLIWDMVRPQHEKAFSI